jgi:hypothetical protein
VNICSEICCRCEPSRLRVVMVSILAIIPMVCGFKTGRDDGFLGTIQIRSTPSFGEKVKPEAPRRKILRHVKKLLASMKKYLSRPNSSFLSPVTPACFHMTAGRIASGL